MSDLGMHERMPAVLPTMFPGPVCWRDVFGRVTPLEVELGFGRPHFLLERGRPGPTWRWFLNRVNYHHSRLVPGPAAPLG